MINWQIKKDFTMALMDMVDLKLRKELFQVETKLQYVFYLVILFITPVSITDKLEMLNIYLVFILYSVQDFMILFGLLYWFITLSNLMIKHHNKVYKQVNKFMKFFFVLELLVYSFMISNSLTTIIINILQFDFL